MQIKKFTCNGKHKSKEEEKLCPICSRRKTKFNFKNTKISNNNEINKINNKINIDNNEIINNEINNNNSNNYINNYNISNGINGSTPSVFVGKYGYPNVQLGFMSLSNHNDNAKIYDDPNQWGKYSFSSKKILNLRNSLIYSHFISSSNENSRYIDIIKRVAMSKKQIDLDIKFLQKPIIKFNFDKINTVIGPRAKLQTVKETTNANIPIHIDKVNSQEDLKTIDAISYLKKHNYNENYISKILSVGILGEKNQRKIVPTKWSITATDDMLSKENINKIKNFKNSNIQSYFGNYLNNYYIILFMGENWSYELFESTISKNNNEIFFSSDFEYYNGRKSYVNNTAGAYYSIRLSITEKLLKLKRQSNVFVFRIITPEYKTPLGVWVTREGVRKTLEQKAIEFSDINLMKIYMEKLIKKKFGFNIEKIFKESKLLNIKQTTLGDFQKN